MVVQKKTKEVRMISSEKNKIEKIFKSLFFLILFSSEKDQEIARRLKLNVNLLSTHYELIK